MPHPSLTCFRYRTSQIVLLRFLLRTPRQAISKKRIPFTRDDDKLWMCMDGGTSS